MRTHLVLMTFLLGSSGCVELIHAVQGEPDKGLQADEAGLGPVYAANRGKIRFASAPIPRVTPANFEFIDQTPAEIDQPIWTRAYLAHSAHRMMADSGTVCGDGGQIQRYLSIDGGQDLLLGRDMLADKAWNAATTTQIYSQALPLLPDSLVLPSNDQPPSIKTFAALATLTDGEHRLTFRLKAECNDAEGAVVLAEGQLTVHASAAGRLALARRIKLATAYLPAETASLAAVVAATYADDRLLHFRILDDAWNLDRSPEGVPLRRWVTGYAVLQKQNACRALGFKVVQASEGGGSYGQPVLRGFEWQPPLDPIDVPCELGQLLQGTR
jgi:hypothetical protein